MMTIEAAPIPTLRLLLSVWHARKSESKSWFLLPAIARKHDHLPPSIVNGRTGVEGLTLPA